MLGRVWIGYTSLVSPTHRLDQRWKCTAAAKKKPKFFVRGIQAAEYADLSTDPMTDCVLFCKAAQPTLQNRIILHSPTMWSTGWRLGYLTDSLTDPPSGSRKTYISARKVKPWIVMRAAINSAMHMTLSWHDRRTEYQLLLTKSSDRNVKVN